MIDLVNILKKKYNLSGRQAKKFIRKGSVIVNKKPINSRHIDENDLDDVTINIDTPKIEYNLDDFLIKRSDYVLFFYKPPFMHTERITPFDPLTLQDVVMVEFPDYSLISRLDHETDGVVAAVRNLPKFSAKKEYLAFISGRMTENIKISNKIDASHRKKVRISDEKKDDETLFKPIKYFKTDKEKDITLVSISLAYAERHQIRAYCAYLKMPIIGDTLYGKTEFSRLLLHCKYTKIESPYFSQNEIKAYSPNWKKFVSSFD